MGNKIVNFNSCFNLGNYISHAALKLMKLNGNKNNPFHVTL